MEQQMEKPIIIEVDQQIAHRIYMTMDMIISHFIDELQTAEYMRWQRRQNILEEERQLEIVEEEEDINNIILEEVVMEEEEQRSFDDQLHDMIMDLNRAFNNHGETPVPIDNLNPKERPPWMPVTPEKRQGSCALMAEDEDLTEEDYPPTVPTSPLNSDDEEWNIRRNFTLHDSDYEAELDQF